MSGLTRFRLLGGLIARIWALWADVGEGGLPYSECPLSQILRVKRQVLIEERRDEVVAMVVDYYQKLRVDYPDTPIVLGGDFNASLESQELVLLARTDLVDFHDALGTPAEDRFTYMHFDHAGAPLPETLDYLLISPQLKERIEKSRSFVYRYKGPHGITEQRPDSLQKRLRLPSDHYPQVLTVRLT